MKVVSQLLRRQPARARDGQTTKVNRAVVVP
jgi:hypothetical protein